MKQSVKTLGVAALGAAFAAVGAGTAGAAPQLPDVTQAVDSVARTLPAETVSDVAPLTANGLEQTRHIAGEGLTAAPPLADQVVAEQLSDLPVQSVAGLLGGMPAKGRA
ncbi:ATP-binding protein [Streptomyces sp. MH13]|uniref:ATP-binding protein n=1 Tax=unclassified Streptomyces TaxID=2593676 RepID=UPI003CF62776